MVVELQYQIITWAQRVVKWRLLKKFQSAHSVNFTICGTCTALLIANKKRLKSISEGLNHQHSTQMLASVINIAFYTVSQKTGLLSVFVIVSSKLL